MPGLQNIHLGLPSFTKLYAFPITVSKDASKQGIRDYHLSCSAWRCTALSMTNPSGLIQLHSCLHVQNCPQSIFLYHNFSVDHPGNVWVWELVSMISIELSFWTKLPNGLDAKLAGCHLISSIVRVSCLGIKSNKYSNPINSVRNHGSDQIDSIFWNQADNSVQVNNSN